MNHADQHNLNPDIESAVFSDINALHRAFLLTHNNMTYFGVNNNVACKYPQIYPDDLYGQLIAIHNYPKSTEVTYKKIGLQQKQEIFSNITESSEVTYPFPVMDATGNPAITPNEWWESIEPNKLDQNENELRQTIIENLSKWLSKTEELIAYDPACSTGEFLVQYKHQFPNSKLVASDVSPIMVAYAKNKIERVFVSDAQYSEKYLTENVDVLFLRFLNYEVVTAAKCLNTIEALLKIINENGFIVVFGYTPVLPSVPSTICNLGFYLVNRVLKVTNSDSLVQAYIFKKISLP